MFLVMVLIELPIIIFEYNERFIRQKICAKWKDQLEDLLDLNVLGCK